MKITKKTDKKTKKDTDKPKKQLKNIQVNDRLVDKLGRPYFFKHKDKTGLTITPEIINQSITYPKDNIFLPTAGDNEYTQPVANLKNLTVEQLAKNDDKQLLQILSIDKELKKIDIINGLFELSKKKRREKIDIEHIKLLDQIKQQATLNLTIQTKHILYEDAEILINPKVKPFHDKHVLETEYHYPTYNPKGCYFIDFLNLKLSTNVSIKRFSPDNYQEFINYQRSIIKTKRGKLPVLYIKQYSYYGIADLAKSYGGDFLEDVLLAIRKGKITHKRRLGTGGYNKGWFPNWVINIDGLEYRIAIEFIDLSGLHGKVSYETVLENVGMKTDDKNLLNDLKDNMLLAMITRPKDFKKYAIGDLNLYEVYQEHNKLIYKVYQELGIEHLFKESKLTTGAFVVDIQEAVLKKQLNLDKLDEKTAKELLEKLTFTATPQYLKGYVNLHQLKKDANLKKHIASKTLGGRCYNNRMLNRIINDLMDLTICDIDISGAYTTIASSLPYYFGHPVIENFTDNKTTLKEFLKFHKNDLEKRGYKLVVQTKEPLKIEQDKFPSWTDLRFKTEYKRNTDFEVVSSLRYVSLESTKTDIFTKELHNSTLTWDDIDWLLNECNKSQRDELLNNLYMICAIYYPSKMKCQNVFQLNEKIAEHEKKGNGTFNKVMPHASIDTATVNSCNYWCEVNFGEMICDAIRLARAKFKSFDETKNLAQLFKLIGNTLYGVNVSQYFTTSNIVFAANITSMCRGGMWYVEKALNITQTITDGGVFMLNEVVHLIYGKIDTSFLVRAYHYKKNRDLANNNKWNTKPITKNGEKIKYEREKGWLIDGNYYGCDVNLILSIEKQLENIKLTEPENKIKISELEKTLKGLRTKITELFVKISRLSMEHVQKVFSKNDLLNGNFKHFKTDDKGEIIFKGDKAISEYKKGLFNFEVKSLTDSAAFHGSADYVYTDYLGKQTIKMRGYESKKRVISWSLDENNNLVYDLEKYKEELAISQFLNNIKNNPEAVKILSPFTKSSLLKPNQYKIQYRKTFQNSNLKPGDDIYEVVMLPILTLRFKFQTLEQKQNWMRYATTLKNRYGGLSFEIFYMNHDGTVNYKKMMDEIDQLITNGESHPKNIYDKNNHLKRDYKNSYVLKHVELMRQLKNMVRIMVIGVVKYCEENMVIIDKENNINVQPSCPKYSHEEFYRDYEHVTKYSPSNEFWDEKDNFINYS